MKNNPKQNKVVTLRRMGKTLPEIQKIMGFKSIRSVTQYLEAHEEENEYAVKLWNGLCKRLKYLDDNNFAARKIYDYLILK